MGLRRFSLFIIVILTISTGLTITSSNTLEKSQIDITSSFASAALVDHIPFSIDNDTHMATYASSDGWDGNGSSGDPFVIEFYNFSNAVNGISIGNVSYHFVISNCAFTSPIDGNGVGIIIRNSSNGLIADCNFTKLNTGVQLDNLSGFEITRNRIDSNFMGILLNNTSDCSISENTIEKGVTIYGIHIDHWRHSISDNSAQGKPIGYFNNYSGLIDGGMYSQIIMADCDGAMAKYGMDELISVHTRIQLGFCNNIVIEDILTYPQEIGLYAQSTNHTSLEMFNTFGSSIGVLLENCNYWSFNRVWLCSNGATGLRAVNSHYLNLQTCYLYDNYEAISFSNSSYCTFTDCSIYNNDYGLIIDGGFHKITFNSIYSNTIVGLRIMENSPNCSIWGNDLYSNGLDAEDGTGNVWDDGIALGNSYGNYSGPGVYNIPGYSGGIDHYPINYYNYTGPIQVFFPPSLSYPEGTTGNELRFYILSETRYDFEITEGGIGRAGGGNHDWPYQHFSIDGYSEGIYLFEITAEDRLGFFASTNVTLTVTDSSPPAIDSPSLVVLVEGTDTPISWILYDYHPSYFSIHVNESLYIDGPWTFNGETIELSIMNWTHGVYYIIVEAVDDFGNSASAETMVVVFPFIVIDDPDDIVYVEGETGNELNWTILEGEPDSFEIYRNGALQSSGLFVNESIYFNVDDLLIGTYNFTLVLNVGNFRVIDTVYVYVVSEAPPTPTTSTGTSTDNSTLTNTGEFDIPLDFLNLVALSGSLILIAIVYLIYRSSSRPSYDYAVG